MPPALVSSPSCFEPPLALSYRLGVKPSSAGPWDQGCTIQVRLVHMAEVAPPA